MCHEEEIQKLKEKIRELEEVLEKEEEEIKRLRKIEKEFEEFKVKHSHTVSELHKALKIKPDLPSSPNPIGAKLHHKGRGRKSPTHFDREEPLTITVCPDCNTHLEGKTVGIRTRFVITIRIINPAEVIKYLLHRKWCPTCEKLVESEVPGVLPNARFGLNIMFLVMYLHLALRVPFKKICEYFRTIHDY